MTIESIFLISNHSVREATWELEEEMREKHPQLFQDSGMSSLED